MSRRSSMLAATAIVGNTATEMLETAYSLGFNVYAMTDHNVVNTTWDRTDTAPAQADPNYYLTAKPMIEMNKTSQAKLKPLMRIHHPGRNYNGSNATTGGASATDPVEVDCYVGLFEKYVDIARQVPIALRPMATALPLGRRLQTTEPVV